LHQIIERMDTDINNDLENDKTPDIEPIINDETLNNPENIEDVSNNQYPNTEITRKRKSYLKLLWILFVTPFVVAILIFTLISYGKLGFIPSFELLENPDNYLATEIISSDNEVLGTFFLQNRIGVEYKDLSPYLVNALIATEDVRFRSHSGIDGRALTRAILKGGKNGGGSTITQQLAKMLFPREDLSNKIKFIIRKFREWVIAVKLERSYTKDEIITMYFNQFDFLNLAVGIKSSAKVYFNQTPDSLKIEQAAMLVGMAKNPSFYNPLRRPDTTLHRRNVVLKQMLKYDYINQENYDSLKMLPLGLDYQKVDHKLGEATYFREFIRVTLNHSKPERDAYWSYKTFQSDSIKWENNPLFGWCKKNFKSDSTNYNLYKDGLNIYTTIDSRMQRYAEEAVAEHLGGSLQKAMDKEMNRNKYPPFSNDLTKKEINSILNRIMKQTQRYKSLAKAGLSKKEIKKQFNIPVEMSVFSWSGDIDTVMTPLDSIKYYLHFLHAGFMSMEPSTGYVKAYVGGINYKEFQYDHVVKGKRQVGSTIKPFLYTIAMQEGYSPCHEVPLIPTTFNLPDGTTWTPNNAGKNKRAGEMVTLKWGLANSNNFVSAWLMKQFGAKPFVNFMKNAGVTSHIDPVPSMILGTSDISLYEMVGAYSIYANKGIYTEPIFVTRIEDKYGNVLANFNPHHEDVISEQTAYLMINLLMGVVREGTSVRLRYKYNLMNEMAGKTGTTDNHSDGWFMGIIPDLVSGVWVGAEVRSIHFRGIRLGQGANMALPIYANFIQKVYADSINLNISTRDFDKPLRKFSFELDCDKVKKHNTNTNSIIEDSEFF